MMIGLMRIITGRNQQQYPPWRRLFVQNNNANHAAAILDRLCTSGSRVQFFSSSLSSVPTKHEKTTGPSSSSSNHLLLTKEEACRILINQCNQRGLLLNKKLRYKPWRMALMIHRHDLLALGRGGQPRSRRRGSSSKRRDHQEDDDAVGVVDVADGFRHGVTPLQNQIHEWIHANTDATMEKNRFTKRNQKIVKQTIVEERSKVFVQELIDGLGMRNINFSRHATKDMKSGKFLNHLSILMAQAFKDGKGKLGITNRNKKKNNNKSMKKYPSNRK